MHGGIALDSRGAFAIMVMWSDVAYVEEKDANEDSNEEDANEEGDAIGVVHVMMVVGDGSWGACVESIRVP